MQSDKGSGAVMEVAEELAWNGSCTKAHQFDGLERRQGNAGFERVLWKQH